jgi:hypothetical protein
MGEMDEKHERAVRKPGREVEGPAIAGFTIAEGSAVHSAIFSTWLRCLVGWMMVRQLSSSCND